MRLLAQKKNPYSTVPMNSGNSGAQTKDTTTAKWVLVCVSDVGSCTLIRLVLEELGWNVMTMPVADWLASSEGLHPQPDVILLEAWPLRDSAVAQQAHDRLGEQASPLILLADADAAPDLGTRLGAVVTLPLFFTLDQLVAGMRQALAGSFDSVQTI